VPEVPLPLRGSLSGFLKMKVQNFFSQVLCMLCMLSHFESLLPTQVYSCGFRTTIDLQNASQYEIPGDSSRADVKPSRKSTICHYIMCNNALVYWRSKVASMLATSTTEAELISAPSCCQDVAFCRKLANGIGVMQTKHSFAGRQ
jgi:hypothetical protein